MGYKKDVLILAVYAGEILLKNGAETYRVEDTLTRICRSKGFSYVETFVTPTGIFICIDSKDTSDEMTSYIKRIHNRSVDLNKIAKVNEFSRNFVQGNTTIQEAMEELRIIDQIPHYKIRTRILFGGIASGFFALLFQSTILEAFYAFITGGLVTLALLHMNRQNVPLFLTNIAGSALLAILAVLFSLIPPTSNISNIIIGSIMVMVPGVAITNAVRDSILGDLLSGLARAAEAIIIAISIAFGVGAILKIWSMIGGVLS